MLTKQDINKALTTLKTAGLDEVSIEADAAAILSSATKAVQKILGRRAKMDAQGLQARPLFILAGEAHDRPSNVLHHMAVITQLKAHEDKTVVAMEYPHDNIKKTFMAAIKTNDNSETAYSRFNAGNYRDNALNSFINITYKSSPYSKHILLHSLLSEDIPIQYTDTSKKRKTHYRGKDKSQRYTVNYIDAHDPSSHNSMMTCLGTAGHSITTRTTDGMWIRNHHMVKTAKDFAAQTGARIVIQICGAAHVVGDGYKRPPSQSLAALFKKSTAQVMGYRLSSDMDFLTILGAMPYKNYIRVSKPPGHSTSYTPENSTSVSLNLRENEEAYVRAVMNKMGIDQYALNDKAYKNQRKAYKKELNGRFKSWLKLHSP